MTYDRSDMMIALEEKLKEAYEKTKPLVAGKKDDSSKLPVHLIAPETITSLAKVLEFGAKKYSARNWEAGMDWSRVYSALQRHSWAWWAGEAADPETGFSHLEHALCCLMFLNAYEQRKVGNDDRPT